MEKINELNEFKDVGSFGMQVITSGKQIIFNYANHVIFGVVFKNNKLELNQSCRYSDEPITDEYFLKVKNNIYQVWQFDIDEPVKEFKILISNDVVTIINTQERRQKIEIFYDDVTAYCGMELF